MGEANVCVRELIWRHRECAEARFREAISMVGALRGDMARNTFRPL